MRWAIELLLALDARCVARTKAHADRGLAAVHFGEWLLQILLEIVAERSQRRDVNGAKLLFKFAVRVLDRELIQHAQKCGECFARAGWRNDEDVCAFCNARPCAGLRRGGFVKARLEPIKNWRFGQWQAH